MESTEFTLLIDKQFQDNEPSAIFNAMAHLASKAMNCQFEEAMFVLNTIVAIEIGKMHISNIFQSLSAPQQVVPAVAKNIMKILQSPKDALDELITDAKNSSIQQIRDSYPIFEDMRNDMC